jgi:hypothetical protein
MQLHGHTADHVRVTGFLGHVERGEQAMPQRDQVGQQRLRLGFPQPVEIDLGIRPGDQLGAQLRRQVCLTVPINRIGAEVISAGKRRHGHATGQTQVNGRALSMRADRAGSPLQFRPFKRNQVPRKKMNSLSVKSISAKTPRSHRKSAPR